MTLTLPDDPALADMSESDIRLDLACALFAAGRISRSVASRMAGMERFDFDMELVRRRIPSYTEEMLEEDIGTLEKIFSHRTRGERIGVKGRFLDRLVVAATGSGLGR